MHCSARSCQAVSWGLIVGIMLIVAVAGAQTFDTGASARWFRVWMPYPKVKRMPYPYRAILDAGVCAGLSWGMGPGPTG